LTKNTISLTGFNKILLKIRSAILFWATPYTSYFQLSLLQLKCRPAWCSISRKLRFLCSI